jgi:hypothetical protein
MSETAHAPVQEVTTAELRAALQNSLAGHFGGERRIARLERRPSAYRTSSAIEELDVHLDDGTTLRLLFKDLSRHAMLEGSRRVKPAFLYDPLREIETYRTILAPNRLGAAIFYGAVVDQRVGRYWLFLERVEGVELYQVGEFAAWQCVARYLAVMHTHFAGETEPLLKNAHLLYYDGAFYRLWIQRAQAFLRQTEPSRVSDTRRGIEWLAGHYDRVIENLLALPVTFIHGEFYASNILVQETSGDTRVCPVDWEMAAVGPGLIDVAALTSGKWTEEEKEALALAYHAALAFDNSWPPAPEALLGALQWCRLHLAVQWLGWSPDWSPPAENAQDWLGEAMRLAEELGL